MTTQEHTQAIADAIRNLNKTIEEAANDSVYCIVKPVDLDYPVWTRTCYADCAVLLHVGPQS